VSITHQTETPRHWPSHEHQVRAERSSARKRSAAGLIRRLEAAVPLTSNEHAAALVALAINV
jgi:hypothetical protein